MGGAGAAQLTNDAPTAGTADDVLLQCMAVSPGQLLLRLKLCVPSPQADSGEGHAVAYAYGDSACGGPPVAGSFYTVAVRSAEWRGTSVVLDVPAGAGSVSVRLVVQKDQAGGSLDVLVDDVELIPGVLFADGFESWDLAAWSDSQP